MGFALEVLGVAIALSAAMGVAWLVAERTGRSGWIDAIWTFATGLAGMALALLPASPGALRPILVAGLALLWSLRLGVHIVLRTARRRRSTLSTVARRMGRQGERATFLVSSGAGRGGPRSRFVDRCSGSSARNPARPSRRAGRRAFCGCGPRRTSSGSATGPLRGDPKNKSKICDVGLWGCSRHPNYFFEWLVWVALAIIAIAPVGHYPWGWFGLAAPVLMYVLLVHVSGIPPLEAHMLRSRGDAFRLYQARVNAFWPGPSKPKTEILQPGAAS